jgi:hypothetical protein
MVFLGVGMFKITNNSTTHLAVENGNLAPRQSTMVAAMTEPLRYLESKGAIKVETIKDRPRPVTTPTVFIPKFKKEKK